VLRINRETDYAIRIILALARLPEGTIISSASIQREMLLPNSLSLQVISRLAHHKLINTYPGRNGGIQLALPPAEVSLNRVILAMEGPLVLSECLEEDHFCPHAPTCPVHKRWQGIQAVLAEQLEAVNFGDLATSTHPLQPEDVQ
jgi:Rrf2 family nitric oxide-sensitive transcriptional repressor